VLDIRRRAFITLVGGAAATTWSGTLRAQQAARLPTIGWVAAGFTQDCLRRE
jgi:hypothetical protein